jgi:hypothetical protein
MDLDAYDELPTAPLKGHDASLMTAEKFRGKTHG